MITNAAQRSAVARALGAEIDDLVRERLRGLVEEPDITSRIGQRLEDRFDGQRLGGHKIRVMTETIPSHGGNSLEKPTGADLYIAISVRPLRGPEVTKGVLVQAKRDDKITHDWRGLSEQCRRMCKITRKGSVVWTYGRNGVGTMRAAQVDRAEVPVLPLTDMFDAILECEIGDKRRVPPGEFGDRAALANMIRDFGVQNAIWLEMEAERTQSSAGR
jgi:hypothetical protein